MPYSPTGAESDSLEALAGRLAGTDGDDMDGGALSEFCALSSSLLAGYDRAYAREARPRMGPMRKRPWQTWELEAIEAHGYDLTAQQLHDRYLHDRTPDAIQRKRARMCGESAGVSTCRWCGARPVWSDVARARREGLCRECYTDIHGGYSGPTITQRPIGDLTRMKDDEIKALDRWLDAETAARLLGRSVRTVQRWGQDGRLRSNGMWPRVYYYKLDVLTEFGFSPLYAGALSGQ